MSRESRTGRVKKVTFMNKFKWSITAGVVLIAAVASPLVHAQSAKDILQKSADYMRSLPGYTVDFELLFDAKIDDEEEKFSTDYTVVFRRPGEAMVHMANELQDLTQYTSDTETTRYLAELDQYIVEQRGTPPPQLMTSASNNIIMPAVSIFAETLQANPFMTLLRGADPIQMVGQETVNGVDCDRIRVTTPNFDCDLWIERGKETLIHRIQPDMSGITVNLEQQGMEVHKFIVQLDVLHWQPGHVDESLLNFSPKEGSMKVAQFHRPPPPAPAEVLVGKVAPTVDLKTLAGEDFSVASKKGEEIVVLDFWATWCGPCRKGMPILDKVTREFADKGVRTYAVNLREDASTIQEFLDSSGLDLNVVLDLEAELGGLYMANAIPQMVIIGKDGLVSKIHVGVGPNYEADIRAEFEELTK